MSKEQILTMIGYYEEKQEAMISSIELAIIKDTLSLLRKALATPPRTYYAEGEDRVVCPNKDCLDGWGISVHKGENFCTECGQAIEWTDEDKEAHRIN